MSFIPGRFPPPIGGPGYMDSPLRSYVARRPPVETEEPD